MERMNHTAQGHRLRAEVVASALDGGVSAKQLNDRQFGDSGYAREKLVAELGVLFMCADLGITPEIRDDHAAYLGHRLTVLKEDSLLDLL